MKKITIQIFAFLAFSFTWQANAQVNISEDFNSGTPAGWTDSYSNSANEACEGASERDNLWSNSATGNLTAPNLVGASNGTDLAISFDYKVVEYSFSSPTTPQAAGWGSADIQYSTDDGANWLTALTIDDSNHVVSASCANISVTVPAASLPNGSDVKLRVNNTWLAGDYFFYVDNFVAQQDLGCTAADITSSTVVDDCGNSQFSIDVNVASVGDGTIISDGLGGSFPLAVGTVTAGPYTIGEVITLTVEHSVVACNFSLGDFITGCAIPGEVCENAIMIGALPYNTTDDTSNYGDNYDGSPGTTSCNTTSSYLNGDDVVYEYTATSDTSINVSMTPTATYSGIFVYTDCADIGVACAEGASGSGSTERNFDLAVTNGTTYYFLISTWASPQSTAYTLNIAEITCTAATVNYSVIDNCAGSGGFFIDVEVTDMGTATDLTVSDDQGSASQALTAAGTLQFGPYVNATDVIITIDDDNDDGSCTVTSTAFTQMACPPANDDCSGAIALTIGNTFAGTTFGATGASSTSCNGTIGNDVWYTVVGDGGDLTITVDSPDEDSQIGVFESVDCAGITLGSCDFSIDPFTNPVELTFTSVAGTNYYVQVGGWLDSADPSNHNITVNTTLSTQNFEDGLALTYYPNPVTNVLNIKAQNAISNVAVYNMLGQEVLRMAPNTVASELDMSNLQTGAYFVKVTIGNATETIRIIKN